MGWLVSPQFKNNTWRKKRLSIGYLFVLVLQLPMLNMHILMYKYLYVCVCLILSHFRDCPWALSQGALLLWTWPRDLRQRLENQDVSNSDFSPNHDELSSLVIIWIMTLIRSNSCAFFRLLHLRPFVAHIKSKIKKAQKEAEKAEAVEVPPPKRLPEWSKSPGADSVLALLRESFVVATIWQISVFWRKKIGIQMFPE